MGHDRLNNRQNKAELAIALLKKGIPIDLVAETSGLSIEILQKLQEKE
jgi:hypothetical protein